MNISRLKNLVWRILKKMANLNFAIFILLCIAFFSIIGSILEQEQNVEYYQINYPINNSTVIFLNWKIILLFGLDHIYSTWWFLSILFLFSTSLIVCTFSSQLPSLKNARRWKFLNIHSTFNKQIQYNLTDHNLLSNMIYALNYKNYYVFHKKMSLYGYKGLSGRIGPIFVHFSIIISLIGFISTTLGSVTVQEMIPSGEVVHFKNIIKSGIYSTLPSNIVCKINSFFITYNSDNSIKQFFSDIYLLNNEGQVLVKKIIKVNSPLRFNKLTFYQTDWNINALRLKINIEKIIQQPVVKMKVNNQIIWVGTLSMTSGESLIFLIFNLKDPILIYDQFGNYLKSLSLMKNTLINNNYISVQDILVSTGLQIKVDPGISLVYFGFFIIMISTIVSYISYCQIWVNFHYTHNTLEINGLVNRGMLNFKEDLSIIQIKYLMYTTQKEVKF